MFLRLSIAVLAALALAACDAETSDATDAADTGTPLDAAPACERVAFASAGELTTPSSPNAPDARAVDLVLYELQVRSANACDPDVGSEAQRAACEARPHPRYAYRGEGSSCSTIGDLERIRLGTLDDLVGDTADRRDGITLRYIDEVVGATGVWLQPIFPNNDRIALPTACDNLGSPYAVRDYFHPRGTLGRACIEADRYEYDDVPCWADDAFDALIAEADARGLIVMLDVAFNHFGHDYRFYDYVEMTPIRDQLEAGVDEDALWDFDATFDERLVWPEVLDGAAELTMLANRSDEDRARLDALTARCPDLRGDALVRAFNTWRVAFDNERRVFPCDAQHLEHQAPGFYLGADGRSPSTQWGDDFTRDWYDVKFLFHRTDDRDAQAEFLRTREYVFRVMNYWVSRGVGGFRLDHATDDWSGIRGEHWQYILDKLDYYAARRGQAPPIILAEEFHHQDEMSAVADIMTEGFLFDMAGRGAIKDRVHVERALRNADRFAHGTLVLTHLENHDELRLTDGTGFDPWTGAGFWALGAAQWSTPMLLVGQEFGQPERLGFKRSHAIGGRFEGTEAWWDEGEALSAWYRRVIEVRASEAGEPLRSTGRRFLTPLSASTQAGAGPQTDDGADDVVAMVRWDDDGDAILLVHNLWPQDVTVRYAIPQDIAAGLGWSPCDRYRAVDLVTGSTAVTCRTADEWTRGVSLWLPWDRRMVWGALERCD